MFDLYIRVSCLGDRSDGEATEVYEGQCREWADRAGLAIDEVEEDTDVSGATAVAERKLERLVQKVEAGESEGIVTPYLDRFGRDLGTARSSPVWLPVTAPTRAPRRYPPTVVFTRR